MKPAQMTVDVTFDLVQVLKSTEEGICGCCLHIITDDQNVRTSDVEFCLDWAAKAGHPLCRLIAEALLPMTEDRRLEAIGYDDPDERRSLIENQVRP